MISLSVFFLRRVYLKWDRISTYLKESPAAIPNLHFVRWTIDRHIDEGPLVKVLYVVCVVVVVLFRIKRHEFLLEFVGRFRVRRNVHRSILCDGSSRQTSHLDRAQGQERHCHRYDPPQFHDQDDVKFVSLRRRASLPSLFHTVKSFQLQSDLWRAQRYRHSCKTINRNDREFFHRPDDIIVSSFC